MSSTSTRNIGAVQARAGEASQKHNIGAVETIPDPAAAGTTITVTDTGAGSDSIASINVSLNIAETGTGSDALPGTSVSFGLSDSGAGADSLAINVDVVVTDVGSAAEAIVAAVSLAIAETGAGSDSLGISASVPVADEGAGSDAITITVSLAISDTASGTDLLVVAGDVIKTLTDTGVGVDVVSIIKGKDIVRITLTIQRPLLKMLLKIPEIAGKILVPIIKFKFHG